LTLFGAAKEESGWWQQDWRPMQERKRKQSNKESGQKDDGTDSPIGAGSVP